MERLAQVLPLQRPEAAVALAERSDDELMLLTRAGRAEAFDELVRRHQRRLLRYCHKVLGDAALAQDAAQGAFLEAYRYLPRYQARGTFEVFLQRLAVNQCRMLARSARTRAERLDQFGREPTRTSQLPDEQLLAQERRREVERALGALGQKHREVVALRFAAGMPLEQVAQVVGAPLGTVKSRLFNGLRRLKEELTRERP